MLWQPLRNGSGGGGGGGDKSSIHLVLTRLWLRGRNRRLCLQLTSRRLSHGQARAQGALVVLATPALLRNYFNRSSVILRAHWNHRWPTDGPNTQGSLERAVPRAWSHRRRSLNPVPGRKCASLFLFLLHPQPPALKNPPFTPGLPKQRGESAALRVYWGTLTIRSRALHRLAKIRVFQNDAQLRFYS